MTADFCCSCEFDSYGVVVMKEHWGNLSVPPHVLTGSPSNPTDADNIMRTNWNPWNQRYLVTHHVLDDNVDSSNNRTGTWTINQTTGNVSYSGSAGWTGLMVASGWSGSSGPFGVDVLWYYRNAVLSDPAGYIVTWDRQNLITFDGRYTKTIQVSSEYTLVALDGDANTLLDAFAPGDVPYGDVGGAAYARGGSLMNPRGEYFIVGSRPYFDPLDFGFYIGSPFDSTGWEEASQYTGLSGSPIMKSVVSRGSATKPKLAAFAIYLPAWYYNTGTTTYEFPPLVGSLNKFTSWIPVTGKYTRTTYRKNRGGGAAILTARQHLTGSGLIHTLAPAVDAEYDIWITLQDGWIGDEIPSSAQATDSTASDFGSTADPN